MAITNHERVGKALELLKSGLAPFVEREIKSVFGAKWTETVKAADGGSPLAATANDVVAEHIKKQPRRLLFGFMWQ